MNAFIIHSGKDIEIVTQKINDLKKDSFHFNPLILKNGNVFWKIDAASKIKKSQMVIFYIGQESHKSPYIAWEIKTAIKYHKPIFTIKLDDSFEKHTELLIHDSFTEERVWYDKEVSSKDLSKLINSFENGDYHIFNNGPDNIDSNLLLEQYKLFLQTSEDLVSRRQSVNSFYISINSAFITIFSLIFTFNIQDTYKLIIGTVFTVIGIVLSTSWIKILNSYGNLNASKMKIISCIEKQMPASLYDAEWEALSDKLNKKKYVSFTESEKRIPKLFIIVYFLIFIVLAIRITKSFF